MIIIFTVVFLEGSGILDFGKYFQNARQIRRICIIGIFFFEVLKNFSKLFACFYLFFGIFWKQNWIWEHFGFILLSISGFLNCFIQTLTLLYQIFYEIWFKKNIKLTLIIPEIFFANTPNCFWGNWNKQNHYFDFETPWNN